MKVIHIETGRHLYGGSLQVSYLIKGLAALEIENVLVCEKNSPLAEKVSVAASHIYREPISGDLDFNFIGRLKQIITDEQPDIVHLHSRRGCEWLGGIAAKWAKVPVVLSRRVDNPENRIIVAVKYRLYNHIVSISEGIRCVLASEGVPLSKLSCVPSAVDIEQYQQPRLRTWFNQEFGIDKNQFVIGVVAQLIPRKGHQHLLNILPELIQRYSHIRVMFFGQGPAKQQLLEQVKMKGLSDSVSFEGFRDDLPQVLPNLDLLVHPAEMEGLGVSLLQAAAAGVPIVATAAGGMPEIVRHGMTGLLVAPKDSQSLKQAIETMLTDSEQANRMAQAGRELVKVAFSIPAMVQGNLAIYQRVLAKH